MSEAKQAGPCDHGIIGRCETCSLRNEVALFRSAGIVEIAVRNPSVAEYMRHWEGRAEKAERENADLRRQLAESHARVEELKQHAIKYLDPLLGADTLPKDAEDWIENRMARHGEGHHQVGGIYPCDMFMLLHALKKQRLELHRAKRQLAEARNAALEEAATLCIDLWPAMHEHWGPGQARAACDDCAAAIRARKT